MPLASENRISFVSQVGTAAQPPATLQCSAHWRGRAFSLGIRLYPQLWPRLEKKKSVLPQSAENICLLQLWVVTLCSHPLTTSFFTWPLKHWWDVFFHPLLQLLSGWARLPASTQMKKKHRECFFFICLSGLVWARPASKQGQFALQKTMVLFITCNF